MSGNLFVVSGSVHDQLTTEGAAEIAGEGAAAIAIVAANIDDIVSLADNIDGDLASIPTNVTAAASSATAAAASAAQAAISAASAVGIDTAAQSSALAAQASATNAEGHALAAATSAEDALNVIEGASDLVADAEAAATLADRYANEAPGVEVTAGKFSSLHYIAEHQALLATAPNMQGRVFGTHSGEEGTNGVEQEFSNVASDFGRAIMVNRLANRPARLKLAAGLYTGPPEAGADFSMVPIVIMNRGLSDLTIEGPAEVGGGTQVLKPTVIAADIEVMDDSSQALPADHPLTVTIDIPAGSNRRAFVLTAYIDHTSTTVEPDLTCSIPGVTITKRGTAGTGDPGGSQPIWAVLWEVDIPGSGALTAAEFTGLYDAGVASALTAVKVLQNVSGTEDYAVTLRAGAATTETQSFSPSQADSTTIVFALQQGAAANPITLTPNNTVNQGKTSSARMLKDFAYAIAVDTEAAASSQLYTGISSHSSPAVIGGMVFLPVTESTGGGGSDDLIWNGTPPAVLEPGNTATVWALSDGIYYYLDMQP
ncbi:MAG: hypothetical protein K0R44_1144 [Thermomicrobiales bacterium]|nr:hypothetical protein [Thermomicrobiales bacterium]